MNTPEEVCVIEVRTTENIGLAAVEDVVEDIGVIGVPPNSLRLLPVGSSSWLEGTSAVFEDVSTLSPPNTSCLFPAKSRALLEEMSAMFEEASAMFEEVSLVFEEASAMFEEASLVFETSTLPLAPSTLQTSMSKKHSHGDKPLQRNIFIDLEAVEDYRNEDEILADGEDDDFDDFLNDEVYLDNDDTAGPRQISHKLAASTISELEWEGLLECAEQRTWQKTAPGEHEQDNSEEDDSENGSEEDDSNNDQHHLERMGLAKLWRVAVKEGYEETAPIVIFNKILKAGWTSVTSVFGRVSCPGWIFVKAASISEVQKVCMDLSDIYIWQL
ncbi:hypothetical protein DXG01_017034 [Tephrocybe rancida]|nr:hypothetical protein DXG01_017034 [Tephrocybe rancida]